METLDAAVFSSSGWIMLRPPGTRVLRNKVQALTQRVIPLYDRF